jgi:hypothetical protein
MSDARVKDFNEKIQKEKMVLEGALKMHNAQTDPNLRKILEVSIKESRQRIEFLEAELKKLSIQRMAEVLGKNVHSPDETSKLQPSVSESSITAGHQFGILYLISRTSQVRPT